MELDLTTNYPRSVREKMLGIVQLARTIDKAKAAVAGKLGDYRYDCPMDKHLFEFLNIDGNALLEQVRNAKTDAEVEAYVRPFVEKIPPSEIRRFNEEWLKHGPEAGSPSAEYFKNMLNGLDPSRTDITSWADLLDLDEKREVPRRVAA